MKIISQILFVKMLEHQLASENKFGQVDFRSHLPEWQVEIFTKVTPCCPTYNPIGNQVLPRSPPTLPLLLVLNILYCVITHKM
jgi:hypothetical protein